MQKIIANFLIVSIISFCSAFSQTYKKSELEDKRAKTIEEIEFTAKLIEETKAKSRESINELKLVNHKIEKQSKLIETIDSEIELLDKQIIINEEKIEEIEDKQDGIKRNYAKSIYLAYKHQQKENFLLYVFASENINQAYKRFRYLQILNSFRKRQVGMLLETKKQLEEETEKLEKTINDKKELQVMNEEQNNIMMREKGKQKRLLGKLKEKEKELKAELKRKQEVAREIEKEIEKIINEERKRSAGGNIYATLTKEEKIISDEFGKNYGKLPWPTKQGIVVGKFGEQDHPSIRGIKVRNDGIYIATIKNAEVRCIFKGVVTRIFSIPGSNYTMIIKHGNYYTLYHNLVDIRVANGSTVGTKEVIGAVATDLDKNETVLHFQIWKETERNDPELWLSR